MVDRLSEYISRRKGLLPLTGIILILINLIFQFVAPQSTIANSNLLLHLGVIIAILGWLLARAL